MPVAWNGETRGTFRTLQGVAAMITAPAKDRFIARTAQVHRGRVVHWIVPSVLLHLCVASAAYPAITLEQVGAWGGHCRRVELFGDRAVASFGGAVTLVNVSNPYAPFIVGGVDLDRMIGRIAIQDSLIFAGVEDGGLRIVDAGEPDALRQIGSLNMPATYGIAVSGAVAYLVLADSPLRMIDVSDPTAPTPIGDYLGLSVSRTVAVSGSIAYVTGDDAVVHMLDVSAPADPLLLHTLSTLHKPISPALSGDYLFVPQLNDVLAVFRVLGVPEPELVFQGQFDGFDLGQTAVDGGLGVVLSNGGQIRVMDVADPGAPAMRGGMPVPIPSIDVDLEGSLAAVAGTWGGLGLIDLSEPDAPALIGTVPSVGGASDVAVRGEFAYVADAAWQTPGLHVVDVSNPSMPREIAVIDTAGFVNQLAIIGDYLFATADLQGVLVYDLSDPALPLQIGSHNTLGWAVDMKVVGDLAYVADTNRLRILSVADVTHPTQVGSGPYDGSGVNGVAVDGDYAFVANGWEGLGIYDVANPSAPVRLGVVDSPGYAIDVEVRGGVAFVADDGAGVMLVDVSDPLSPEPITQINTSGYAVGLRLTDRYLFVGNDTGGIRMYDISNPHSPIAVASKTTAGLGWGVDIAGDYLYAATFHGGLNIYEIHGALGACCRTTVCGECPSGQCRMLPPYTCDAPALMAGTWTACRGDVDGNGRVTPGDRGHIGANFATLDPAAVCRYDLNGDGLVNTADRDAVSSLIGQCQPLPDFQNGSGLNNGATDPRFGVEPEYRGLGSMCPETPCESD